MQYRSWDETGILNNYAYDLSRAYILLSHKGWKINLCLKFDFLHRQMNTKGNEACQKKKKVYVFCFFIFSLFSGRYVLRSN